VTAGRCGIPWSPPGQFPGAVLPLAVACIALVFFTPPSAGYLDPELRKPYQLVVVLQVAEHPLLTKLFQDQLGKELRDTVQDALGPALVEVKLVHEHPILADVARVGLRQALEKYHNDAPEKVHVVLVDYVDGGYEIQAAQHDGLTGLTSAAVRRVRLDDPAGRQLVATRAAELIERDFGLTGTVIDAKSPLRVRVLLKGSKLGVPLDQRVHRGDVFAVVQVNRLGGPQRVRDTLLQVVEPPNSDGICICRLHARPRDDPATRLADQPGVLGYRCVKLGTSEGPLRLRLINERGLPHADLDIWASQTGLDDLGRRLDRTGRDGSIDSQSEKFSQVAFVTVKQGQAAVAKIPIPIIEGEVAVRTVVLDKNTGIESELIARRDRHIRRLDESLQQQQEIGNTLKRLLKEKKYQEALDEARTGHDQLKRDLRDLDADFGRLKRDVQSAPLPADRQANLLNDGSRRPLLARIDQELADFIDTWTRQMQLQAQLKERAALIEQARIARNREADFDVAINLYDQAISRYGSTPQLDKEFNDLKTAWALKNETTHREARRFIYDTWPKLASVDQIKKHIDPARRHFEECRKVGDRLAPRKLLVASVPHIQMLTKLQAGLRPERQDERQRLEELQSVAAGLRLLLDDVNGYLSGK
jgi:hypothetical protein